MLPKKKLFEASRSFTYWRDPVFLIGSGLYALNRFLLKPWLPHVAFLHGHFNDCLLVATVLPLFLKTYRALGLRTHDRPPTLREVALHVLMWALFFEAAGPLLFHHGTGDLWDAVNYACGGGVAWIFWNV